MAEIDVSVERYHEYRQAGLSKYGVDVVNGAILLDLLIDGGGGGGGTGATAQNQLDEINKLEALSNTVATEAKQDDIINKNEQLRVLLVDLKARIGNPDVDNALPSQRSLLKSLLDKQPSNDNTQTSDYSNSKTISTSSSLLLAADPKRDFVEIENISDDAIYWFNIGGVAAAGIPGNKRLYPGDTFSSDRKSMVVKAIQIISDKVNSPVTVGISSQP